MANDQLTISVLLVEDSSDDADLILESLSEAAEVQFEVHRVDRLEHAQLQLAARQFDIVLLDLGLPDSSGLRTVETVLAWDTGLPIVVLTGLAEELIGTQAVERGAQTYLVKRMESFDILPANILSALERHQAQHAATPDGSGGMLGRLQRILKAGP